MVMYAVRGADYAATQDVFYRPRHAYTLGLLSSVARLDRRRADRLEPILEKAGRVDVTPPPCSRS